MKASTMTPDELRGLRKGLGLRQAALGELLGMTGDFIGMMERGARPIQPTTALSIRYLVEHPEALNEE